MAHPDTISKLKQFQLWSEVSLSAVTTAAAAAALKDQEFTKDCQEKTAKARTLCYSTFKQLGLDYIPSHTNFILFDVSKISADYRQRMEAKNIMVQYRNFFGGRWCRVSMGTLEEMQEFCNALKDIA